MKTTLIFLLAFWITTPIFSQSQTSPSPIIFIYDASGSMWGKMENSTKMQIAADVLTNAVKALPENQKIGLVAYGHRAKGDCEDVEFLVSTDQGTKDDVTNAVKGIKPLGKTPLAYSALEVIQLLHDKQMKATVILITDGIESCGGNICDVITTARAEGIDFKLHIIGFGLQDEDTEQLKCATKAGDGNYYDAKDAGDLGMVLNEATSTTVDEPDGNVSVFAIKNGVPIDAWVRAYDTKGKLKPISVRTYQDTAIMFLPPGQYNLHAVPLEGSDVDKIIIKGIESKEDEIIHQTISFDAGKVRVVTTNNEENWDCIVKIKDQEGKVAASVRTYTAPKEVEVNPGVYDISIQALGSMEGLKTNTLIEDVVISSGQITDIGHNFSTGHFEIFTKVGAENIDCIVNIKEVDSGKGVGGSRTYTKGATFLLNPGNYEVKVTPLGVHKDKASQTFRINIEQDETVTKELTF